MKQIWVSIKAEVEKPQNAFDKDFRNVQRVFKEDVPWHCVITDSTSVGIPGRCKSSGHEDCHWDFRP
jgi:hypothetical protein